MADTKAAPYKFTTNVPVEVGIRFIDVRPSKMWQEKKLPAQVSLKGTFGGVDTIAYLPGPAWKNIKALADAGVIDANGQEIGLTAANDEGLAETVSVPVAVADVTACLTKLAGERYESMRYTKKGGAAQPQSRRLPPPDSRKLPFDLPDELPEPYAPDPANYPVRQAGMPNLSAPPPSDADAPDWVEPSKAVAPKAEAKARVVREYLDLLAFVQAERPKLSDEAAQAASATIWITWKQDGLR